jgi:hypothetical protein
MNSYNGPQNIVTAAERRAIIERVLGQSVAWNADGEWGYTECPGLGNHNNKSGRRDCRVWAVEKPNGMTTLPPGLHCLHTSCAAVVDEVNHRIRSEIGKAKVRGTGRPASAPASGSSNRNPARTVRTPFFHVSEKMGEGSKEFRTDRTGFSKTYTQCARACTHALPEKGPVCPSEPSGVASTGAQPEAVKGLPGENNTPPVACEQGRVEKTMGAAIDADGGKGRVEKTNGAPSQSDDGDITLIMGEEIQRGRWVNGEWVAIKRL